MKMDLDLDEDQHATYHLLTKIFKEMTDLNTNMAVFTAHSNIRLKELKKELDSIINDHCDCGK